MGHMSQARERDNMMVGSGSHSMDMMAANCNNSNSNPSTKLRLPRVVLPPSGRPTSRHPGDVDTASHTPDIDVDDIEDHVKPVYLRESSVYRAYIRQKEKQEHEQLINVGHLEQEVRPQTSEHAQRPTPKWKVCERNLNAWRENKMDSRNLYSVTLDNLESDDESLLYDDNYDSDDDDDDDDDEDITYALDSGRSLVGNLESLPGDVTHLREKSYIRASRATTRSPESSEMKRFWAQTIREYNRPAPPEGGLLPSYCSPRNSLVRQNSKDFLTAKDRELKLESVTRVPAHLRILPKILRGQFCRKGECVGKQFCDVLGPETCTACIEFANRRVAGEVQKQDFPELDCTVTTLVAPMLSKCMLGSDSEKLRGGSRRTSRAIAKSGFTTRLPTITERSRFGRAGVERGWEEKARRFSLTQTTNPPVFLI